MLTPGRFQTIDAVVDFLLDRVLPAAYTPRPGRAQPSYDLAQAERWLGHLAARMNADGIREFAWWRVPDWQPRPLRVIANGLLAALVFATLGSIAFGLGFGAVALVVGLVAGSAVGAFAEWHPDDRPVQLAPVRLRALGTPRRNNLNVIALITGIAYGSVGGLIFGLKGGAAFGLTFGIAVTLAFQLSVATSALIAEPSADTGTPIDPLTAWRRDKAAGAVVGASFALAFGVLTAVAFGLTFGPARGLTFGVAGSITAGAAISVTLIRTWDSRLAFFQLWRAGKGPLLMMNFLDDAHSRGVLRTVGPVYQFRHARLQDRLADRHR